MNLGIKQNIRNITNQGNKLINEKVEHYHKLFLANPNARDFYKRFLHNLKTCNWKPHDLYSVFTQYDQEYYLKQKDAFLNKYFCFYAVSKTIAPTKIIELGTFAGSSADAYLSASPNSSYVGLDLFGESIRQDNKMPFDPYETAQKLFKARGFSNYELIRADLRSLEKLPCLADFVVVDAAHDFENEYADLQLALTANPKFIFVDDSEDPNQAKPAIEKFLNEDLKDKIDFTIGIKYIGGGLVIKLK